VNNVIHKAICKVVQGIDSVQRVAMPITGYAETKRLKVFDTHCYSLRYIEAIVELDWFPCLALTITVQDEQVMCKCHMLYACLVPDHQHIGVGVVNLAPRQFDLFFEPR
jgi:hypothetical protein